MSKDRYALDSEGKYLDVESGPTPADHIDDRAVDEFARLMKQKMAASRAKGRGGWNDPSVCSVESLSAMLLEHVAKGDPVDVANFCMMLCHYGAKIAAPVDHIVEPDKKDRQADTALDIEALRRIAEAAPRGRWSVWTSNSWRRVFADQRGKHVSVIEPTTQTDGHADLLFGAGVATYLESFPAEVALELLDELAAARVAQADLFSLLERAHRAIDLLLAQMIMAAPDFRPTQSVIWPDMMAIAAALGRKDGA